ncbi:MAG: SDR family NAD(P)-dependent oxidoreductase, partial [Rhodospirillales bacterium]|nr:SDR family NAD(P)-dependent oxidoreductase [Rhodospirillales bacterium]
MIPDLTGKGVFITGAAGGIGRKLVGAFLSTGASVTAADISDHGLRDLAAAHADDGLRIRALDVGNSSDCQGAIVEAGQVDILINNAGVMIPPKSFTKDGFELQFGTNHLGHFALTGHLLPILETTDGSRV